MVAAVLFPLCCVGMEADEQGRACYFLDKNKLDKEMTPLILEGTGASIMTSPLRLDSRGLSRGEEPLCRWSLNGGSGTKDKFSLDGEIAVPILNPACESPFSHELTGVGFGDWYLTLCGTISGTHFSIEAEGKTYSAPLHALRQWSRFEPGKFPIVGDTEK